VSAEEAARHLQRAEAALDPWARLTRQGQQARQDQRTCGR